MTSSNTPAREGTFSLALLQHAPTPCSLDTSVRRLRKAATDAKLKGAQLLVVPEASLTGYNIPLASAQSIAVEREGATTAQLQSVCREQAIALAYGFIERDGDDLFNAVQVIDATGAVISHYRKTHLWGDLDRSLFKAGDAFAPVFEMHGWKLGILICYDIEFPESVRHLALSGCDLVLAPTALMTPWTFVANQLTRARAGENQLYLAYANYCGSEYDIDYVGRSCIVGPDGTDVARAHADPTLLVSTLRLDAISTIRHALPYHRDRRPELYQTLV